MSNTAEGLTPDEERALIEKAQAGDEAALERLLSAHQDRVYRTALGLTGGDGEASFEIAQDVLVSACRHISQFRGNSRFSTWLYRMTVNFHKNHQVASGRRRARFVSMDNPRKNDEDDRPREFADGGPSARDKAAGSEMLEILHAKLGELAEEFRTVLVLRYFEDMSYEEIGESLDLPLGTVKSRINRGRRELRRIMGGILEEGETAQ